MADETTRLHYRTCNLCEAMCGLEIEHDGERILAIRGDAEDPFSEGHICPKAVALQDVWTDPDRLRKPVKKVGGDWVEIGWDEALDRVATGLGEIRDRHGNAALGVYLGNPNAHNLGSMLTVRQLLRAIRTPNVFTATSVDQLPHHLAASEMFGHYFLLPIPDVDRTDFFLVLGANPLASNGSLMTAGGIGRRLAAVGARGGRVVVVDPRRTETAAKADHHYFIRPGSDVLLLLALVRTILVEGLAAPGRLAEHATDLDDVGSLVEPFTPARVAPVTGIAAEEIETLAREFASATSAVCHGRMGLSTQAFGGTCQWLINLLHLLTGNLDRPGGAMFTRPAFDVVTADRRGRTGRWTSRVRGLPERFGELPVATLADEILTPADQAGETPIRGMLTIAGNPVLSTPNGRRLDRAFEELEFFAAVDIYVNETTRHADVILPPTTGLECEHYDVIFHTLAVRNTAKYSPPLFDPSPGALHDWQILRRLARRLAPRRSLKKRLLEAVHPAYAAKPSRILDLGLRTGPHRLSLRRLKAAPHGIDLGALEPCLPDRLFTADRRIRATPEAFVADLPRVEALLGAPAPNGNGFDLELIGRRHLCTNNSWMHNSERLVRGRERCTLLIHPRDAAERGIEEGERVAVESRVGRIEITAAVRDEVMPGVVSIPHGWGHDRKGVRLRVAETHAGVSINDLTDDRSIDPVTGNAAFSGVPVKVEALRKER